MNDPFQSLGLPRRFDLDDPSIRRAYLAKVAGTHPDLAAGASAQGDSAELNRSRDTLLNPELRADALLRLLGGPSKESDKSLPPAFLSHIMETREAIETAKESGDSGEISTWTDWADAERARYIADVGALFVALPNPPPPQTLRIIRQKLNAWRYIERLIEQLDSSYDPNRADFERP